MLPDDHSPSPEEYATQKNMRQDLLDLLQELKPKEREVILLRFGWEGGEELSLVKIGERLNLSRERIRQLESKALATLRRQRHALREYLAG